MMVRPLLSADTIPFLLPTFLKASIGAGVVFRTRGSLAQGRGIDTAVPFLLPIDDWGSLDRLAFGKSPRQTAYLGTYIRFMGLVQDSTRWSI